VEDRPSFDRLKSTLDAMNPIKQNLLMKPKQEVVKQQVDTGLMN